MEDTKLTRNFSLKELTRTDTGIANTIPAGSEVYGNLLALATMLQAIRDQIDKPIIINSGYRSPEVNKAVGGASNSSHLYGLAADIRVAGMTQVQLAEAIERTGIEFDKMIIEPGWIHIQVPKYGDDPDNRIMYAVFNYGKPTYFNGYPPLGEHTHEYL